MKTKGLYEVNIHIIYMYVGMYVCMYVSWYVRIWNFDAKQSMHFLVDIDNYIVFNSFLHSI
jgi:hypothetical protein